MKISDANRQLLQVFCGTLSVALMLLYAFPMAADGIAAVLVAVYFGLLIVAGLCQSATLMLCATLFALLSILTYNYVNGFALVYFLGEIPLNAPILLATAILSLFFGELLRKVHKQVLWISIGLGILCGIVWMGAYLAYDHQQFKDSLDESILELSTFMSLAFIGIGCVVGAFVGLFCGLSFKVLLKEPIATPSSLKKPMFFTTLCTLPVLIIVYPELLDLDYDGLYGTKSNRIISHKVRDRLNDLYHQHHTQHNVKLPLSTILHDIHWNRFCGLHPYLSLNEITSAIPFRDQREAKKWQRTRDHQHFLFIINPGNVIPIDMEGRKFSQIPCENRDEPFSLNLGTWKPEGEQGRYREEVILSLENNPLETTTVPSSGGGSR